MAFDAYFFNFVKNIVKFTLKYGKLGNHYALNK
jgi:hypothetical protein